MRRIAVFIISLFVYPLILQAQVSGDLMLNANFFQRDTSIGAANNALYDNYLSGGESWLTLNYRTMGFDAMVRYDAFLNSNLHNPQEPNSVQGIGFWSVRKDIQNLSLTVGSVYDQFGSGIVFRSYEDRGLGIDNSLRGLRLQYNFNDNWFIKGFVGQMRRIIQNDRFTTYSPVMKGLNMEKYVKVSDKLQINPGIALVNRTIDQTSMNIIVNNINALPLEKRFYPKYNVYVYSFYNTTYYKNFNWYFELAQKSQEAIQDENSNLIFSDGHVYYTTLAYSKKGFGITLQYKETDYFPFRTSANELLLEGVINYLPPLTKLNTFRLLARYPAAALEWGERGYQGDIVMTPKKGNTISINYSYVTDLSDSLLFNEINVEYEKKISKKLHISQGIQFIKYNQEVYQFKPDIPMVEALTPFVEVVYKVKRRKSIRFEFQYLITKQDYGSWAWALLEYNIAPKWSFAVLDMYNIEPNTKYSPGKIHYPTAFVSFTQGSSRFTISYVKQVEGVVCTGGVCRLEPAFSGVKFTLNSSF
ncbi:hypothetical protein JYT51_00650 [Candidatus Amoebophilus asiaticus]|nr:hypothetical protein [Candidatus Amoebophilus asiaticus]